MDERGLDGLTPELLRQTRADWWDDAMTRVLVERIPEESRWLADVGCGFCKGATEVLPARASLRWIGIDADRARLPEARRAVDAAGLAARVETLYGRAEALPLGTGTCDVVLFNTTLMHLAEPERALAQARRVLRSGGRVLAVEPVHTSQHAYYDGAQDAVDDAMRTLLWRARDARRPRDTNIGARLPALVRGGGFEPIDVRVHTVQQVRWEGARQWAERRTTDAQNVARFAGLDPEGEEIAAYRRAARDLVEAGDPERSGCGIATATVVVVVGRR